MGKTNFMIIKSARKRDMEISLNISNSYSFSHALERKQCMIDESLTRKYHIAFVCSRISRNIGIISELRYYLSIQQLKQIYYNLIYPYISYSILAFQCIQDTYKENPSKPKPYSASNIFCYSGTPL